MSFVIRLGIAWAAIRFLLSVVSFQFIAWGSAEFYVLIVSVGFTLVTLAGLLLVTYVDWNPFKFIELDG